LGSDKCGERGKAIGQSRLKKNDTRRKPILVSPPGGLKSSRALETKIGEHRLKEREGPAFPGWLQKKQTIVDTAKAGVGKSAPRRGRKTKIVTKHD